MKTVLTFLIALTIHPTFAQKVSDLFTANEVQITWLGIDYSEVKIIGEFSQFMGAGEKSAVQIKDRYFSAWNKLVLAEQNKYDIRGMLRKEHINFDLDMVMSLNDAVAVENLEAYQTPNYTIEDMFKFIKKYDLKGKSGIGIILLAESLNKNTQEAYYHFMALNLSSGELLLHERIKGIPSGIGIRNYWAGSIYDAFKSIQKKYYPSWRKEYRK